ncbi:hypothetical protein JCM12178A_15500 [Salidesulfovibrio brasiliensis]
MRRELARLADYPAIRGLNEKSYAFDGVFDKAPKLQTRVGSEPDSIKEFNRLQGARPKVSEPLEEEGQ